MMVHLWRRRGSRRRALALEALERRDLLSFFPPVYYPAGDTPAAVAVADFDGDGQLDLAVANSGSATVSVHLGLGDGSFRDAVHYAVDEGWPAFLTVGDFNGDGARDLAVTTVGGLACSPRSVSVLLGNGDGSFGKAIPSEAGGCAFGLAAGDFNGDGYDDLAAATPVNSSVAVLLSRGDGSFRLSQSLPFTDNSMLVVASDFNGDGVLDLAVANVCGNVFLGRGDGSFDAGRPCFYIPEYPIPLGTALTAGDFNGDGRTDLALATLADTCGFLCKEAGSFVYFLHVLPGRGDGTFGVGAYYDLGELTLSLAAADFNGDGLLDLVTAAPASHRVRVWLGRGDGTFAILEDHFLDTYPVAVAAGDFNGDAYPDLAVANAGSATVAVLLNDTEWFAGPSPGPGGGGDAAAALRASPRPVAVVNTVAAVRSETAVVPRPEADRVRPAPAEVRSDGRVVRAVLAEGAKELRFDDLIVVIG